MPLIKCRDGVYRSPLAALEAADPTFGLYDPDPKIIPTPDPRDTPPMREEGADDVR